MIAEIKTYEAWIEELCIVNFLEWDHSDPRKTLAKLIECEVNMALDPAISKQAVDLIEKHGGCVAKKGE